MSYDVRFVLSLLQPGVLRLDRLQPAGGDDGRGRELQARRLRDLRPAGRHHLRAAGGRRGTIPSRPDGTFFFSSFFFFPSAPTGLLNICKRNKFSNLDM